MIHLLDDFVARLDSAYAHGPYFSRQKARLLAVFTLLLLAWVPLNLAKLAWVVPPFVWLRVAVNLCIGAAALWSLGRVRKGGLAQAGNGLALALALPTQVLILFGPPGSEPLAMAVQLLVLDLVFLLFAIVFASRAIAVTVFAMMVASLSSFYWYNFRTEPIKGELAFAADTLLRDGLMAIGFIFCLGITLVHMISSANRHSERALRETRAMNEKLEEMVAERTRALDVAMRQAQESSRAKGEFLANMSHEIRTPLHGIIASTELLGQHSDLAPEAGEHVRVIADSGDLLLRLLSDILDFSKIEAGRLTLEQHAFELGPVVTETLGLLATKSAAAGVHLECSLGEGLPADVVGDSHRLRQVLLNLISNAIKFTPAGGSVEVIAHANASAAGPVAVRFEVRDTGVGMDAATARRIFERFVQADSSTTRRFGGSGLGLPIASHLVRLMGGELEVSSKPGSGSSFFFTLPLARAAQSGRDFPPSEAGGAPLGLRVLIVEDNAVNRGILAAQLTRLGCQHRIACDGEDALVALEQSPSPDVILMDCHMPRLDGWETTRRIRRWAADSDPRRRRLAEIPVVALTAAVLPEERQRCMEAGMGEFLAKPVRLSDLHHVLKRFAPALTAG